MKVKLRGTVVKGNEIGRELGYPTANMLVDSTLDAANGVYAAIVEFDGRRYGAMANLGVKPTFSTDGQRVLELHLFDFEGDLYGREITAELGEFIRSERRFDTPEALREQIAEDEKTVRNRGVYFEITA